MALHDSVTLRIDAPTIAFDRQPTTCFPSGTFARELFDASTMSTIRTVVRPAAQDAITAASPRAPDARRWLVYVVCLGLGVVAGHVVRERQAFATRARSAVEDLRASPNVTLRAPRAANVLAARASNVAVPRANAKPSTPSSRKRPAPARVNAPSPPANAAGDGLFVDFELSFRAPE